MRVFGFTFQWSTHGFRVIHTVCGLALVAILSRVAAHTKKMYGLRIGQKRVGNSALCVPAKYDDIPAGLRDSVAVGQGRSRRLRI